MAFTILMLPHFKPGYFGELPTFDMLFNILRVVSAVATVALLIMFKPKVSRAFFALICLLTVQFVSTLLNENASLYDFIRDNVLQVAVFILYSIFSFFPKKIISLLMLISEVLTYINLFTIITLPDGLYKSGLLGFYHNWFLGYKNQFFPFYLCFFVVSLIYIKYKHHYLRPVLLMSAMIGSLVLAKSSTSIFVFSVFLILFLISIRKKNTLINPYILAGINLGLLLLITFLQTNSVFSFIIEVVLKRDLTLTGRTFIWRKVFDLIWTKPLFGWGVMSLERNISLIGLSESTSAHNLFLNYLLTGGIISLLVFLIFNFMIIRKLYLYRNTYIGKVITLAIFVYNIACLTEAYSNPLIYIIYAFADNIAVFVQAEMEQKENNFERRKVKLRLFRQRNAKFFLK